MTDAELRRRPVRYEDQSYVKRILQAHQDGVLPTTPPGECGHLVVFHDGWCQLLAGVGLCNCRPEIRYSKHAAPGLPS